MRRWIEFNVRHPRIVILVIIAVTALSGFGFKSLYFDGSTEALMPKEDMAYRLGERAKEVFLDSRTFMMTAIEPEGKSRLFSPGVFALINNMVNEIEEFKDFNREAEERRLALLLETGKISVIKKTVPEKLLPEKKGKTLRKDKLESELDKEIFGNEKKKVPEKPLPLKKKKTVSKNELESELDSEIFGDGKKAGPRKKSAVSEPEDIWDLSRPVTGKFYVKALRKRNSFNPELYTPVTLGRLKEKLGEDALPQLNTILRYRELNNLRADHRLTRDQYMEIVESWETVYLYKSMEIVKSFINPISGEDILGSKGELKPVSFIPEDENGMRILPQTEKEFAEYRKKILNNPALKNGLYSMDKNGKIRALAMSILLRPRHDHIDIFNYFMALIEKYNRAPVKLTRIGLPVIQKYIRDFMKQDLLRFMPLVILVVIMTFFLNFRSVRGVFLPTVSVILGTFWTLGIMGLFRIPITLVVNMLPPLLVAVGSSYSIHIFNQYILDREEIEREGRKAGIISSMSHISITVMLAALTTFVGFMTLTVNQVSSLRDFGIFAAFGTLLAVLISSALIPSALVMMKLLPFKKKEKKSNQFVLKILELFNRLALRHAKPVVIIAFILIASFSYGIKNIRVETSPLFQFKKDSYIYRSDIRVGQLFNGSALVNLVIDSGKKNGVKEPEFLKLTEEIREWILRKENREKYLFLHTLSFGDVIKRMHKAMNGEKPEYYSIPGKRSTIEDYLELYSGEDRNSDGRVDSFEQFVDPNYRYANILIRVGSLKDKLFSTSINARGQERVREYLKSHPVAGKYRWYFVGETINFTVLSNLIIRGQILSVILTLLIVALVVFFLFQNWQVGLLSLIPISTSIILVYGTMGYLNIPLDIPKALLAAIAIGIGVDDTIHMLKTIRHNLLAGYSLEESITISYREAGMAIVYTSVALILGFSVLLLSEFVPVFYLGWLVASTMIATTVSALLLLPSVIILFKIPIYRENGSRIFKYINFNRLFRLDN